MFSTCTFYVPPTVANFLSSPQVVSPCSFYARAMVACSWIASSSSENFITSPVLSNKKPRLSEVSILIRLVLIETRNVAVNWLR